MADNLEKKPSQNLSTPNDDFLDWNDYDEEYEEEDNKVDLQIESQNQKQMIFHIQIILIIKIISLFIIIIEVVLQTKNLKSNQNHLIKDMIIIIIIMVTLFIIKNG